MVGFSFKMIDFRFKIAEFSFKMADFSFKMDDFSFKMADFSFKMVGFSLKIADFSFKRACLLQMVSFWGVLWGPPWVWRFSLKTVLGPYKRFGQKFWPVILEFGLQNLRFNICATNGLFLGGLVGPPLGLAIFVENGTCPT